MPSKYMWLKLLCAGLYIWQRLIKNAWKMISFTEHGFLILSPLCHFLPLFLADMKPSLKN